MSRSGAARGQRVTTPDGRAFVLLDKAAPSGWWATPAGAQWRTATPVRLVWLPAGLGEWQVAA